MCICCAGNYKIVVLLTMWLCQLDIFLSIPVTLFMRSLLWKFINTSRLGKASLVEIMACRLLGAKPLREIILILRLIFNRCPQEETSRKYESKWWNVYKYAFAFEMSSAKWLPFCWNLNMVIYAVLTVLRFHPEHSIARSQWNVKSRIFVRHLVLTWHNYTEALSWLFKENSRPQRNFPKLGTELYLHA